MGRLRTIYNFGKNVFNANAPILGVLAYRLIEFKGYLSDFRVYATALSEEDIKELYNTSCIINS